MDEENKSTRLKNIYKSRTDFIEQFLAGIESNNLIHL